jgi:LAO/AO transport system kinase
MSSINKHRETIKEIDGVSPPDKTSRASVEKIKERRSKDLTASEYVIKIRDGHIPSLSKAITLVESTNLEHQIIAQKIVKECLQYSGNSIRIGITGVPGVGKSTFIETFGNHLTNDGKKVAVLAVDPSSSLNKGSILGDKTRMETLVQNPDVFIRPSASGKTLGGVAKKTRETILLCEAAGYDVILIETVGVGQSETAVHSMVDFFLLLKLAGAGDELQGIKRGIIEMADSIVINKADGDSIKSAKIAKNAFENALHLYPLKSNDWQPKVLTCSALNDVGVIEIWQLIQEYIKKTEINESFKEKRKKQEQFWLYDTINEKLTARFYANKTVKDELEKQLVLLAQKKTTPYEVASILLALGD